MAIRKFVCHIMLAVSVMPHQCDHDQQRYSYCLQLNCQPQCRPAGGGRGHPRLGRVGLLRGSPSLAYLLCTIFLRFFRGASLLSPSFLVLFSVLNMLKNARYPCSWAKLTRRRMPPTNIVTSYKWAGYHVGTLRSAAYGLTRG